MLCPACRAPNSPGAKFCGTCGERLTKICGACGAPLAAGHRFCPRCGVAVGTGRERAARFGSPRSYLPPHLADRIAAVSRTLDGERKHVTVLFADIKSSLELLADRDPEDVRKLLDPVLTLMMEAVHHYEGTVNQVMGDGIMALFGAPLAHEDHALRACYAALRIKDSIGRHSEETMVSMGVPVQVRIGINAGEVIVRGIRSDLAMDYTAVGVTVHLASRLEQMAMPSTVLTTAATLALVEGFVRARHIGLVAVRGLAAHVDIAEVTGAEPVRMGFTPRSRAACGRSSGGSANSTRHERRSSRPSAARARSSRWSANRGSASRGSPGSWPGSRADGGGCSWRGAECRMRATSPTASRPGSCGASSRSTTATIGAASRRR
jgi:class 3 adenylate cyclase